MTTIRTGRCHCSAIGFEYRTAIAPRDWSMRECQCRFCREHGALTTSDPKGRLRFTADSAKALERYRFGLKTADFLLCRRCGVYIGARIETARGRYGIVNARAMEPLPDGLPDAVPLAYDVESADERIGRREARWTPVTED